MSEQRFLDAVRRRVEHPSPELAAYVELHQGYINAGGMTIAETDWDAWVDWNNRITGAWRAMAERERRLVSGIFKDTRRG